MEKFQIYTRENSITDTPVLSSFHNYWHADNLVLSILTHFFFFEKFKASLRHIISPIKLNVLLLK